MKGLSQFLIKVSRILLSKNGGRKQEMCRHKSYEKLAVWKDSPDRKPLLLTGVRQCGKTYVLKEFGDRYFEDTAYFSFEGNKGLASVFDYDLELERYLESDR